MGLKTDKTAIIHTKDGRIKITPQGRRLYDIEAPRHVKITNRTGKPLHRRAQ